MEQNATERTTRANFCDKQVFAFILCHRCVNFDHVSENRLLLEFYSI